jgi:hypothetical protein
VAVVAVVTASALAARAVILNSGPTKLPLVGATPSTPGSGRLVLAYDGRPGSKFPGSFVPVEQIWVYSDGHVIVRREGGPSGVGGVATGYIRQRLTRTGVELLVSKVRATGLFDHNLYLRSANGLVWGAIRIRNGDRLVGTYWSGYFGFIPPAFPRNAPLATARQASAIIPLTAGLADLGSWLPISAWADRDPRAFVPSKYAVCYARWVPPVYTPRPLDPARVLPYLPADAQKLLRGRGKTYDPVSLIGLIKPSERKVSCSEVTLRDALTLAKIFRHEGYEKDPLPPSSPANTDVNWRFREPQTDTVFAFEPILPHGQWEPMGG